MTLDKTRANFLEVVCYLSYQNNTHAAADGAVKLASSNSVTLAEDR